MAFLVAALAAMALTGAIRWLALRSGWLDYPNPRSAHVAPLPVSGGVAIVVVSSAWFALAPIGTTAQIVVALCGWTIAIVGFIDDRRPVSKWARLLTQVAAIGVLMLVTREFGPLHVPGLPGDGLLAVLSTWLALTWLVNLYNFMDGIDGLAAAEAVTVGLGLAGCLHFGGYGAPAIVTGCCLVSGASLGFLVWNWPPARIFMGDVGSGFLGFLLGALALLAHREAGLSLFVPLILLAVFVTDATVTLLRRVVRRERWYEPHRIHAYQWLSRRFGSHRPVTLIAIAVNAFWLIPIAFAAATRPEVAGELFVLAYAPVVFGALLAGSGRPEKCA